MQKITLTYFILIVSLHQTYGHGRMEDPPARNAAWRFGFDVPPNYDDVGLNCGGLSIQKANGGKCGVCGDSYSGPRDHEVGGKYSTNTIVRSYLSGSSIDAKILLTANHVGYMEFRLCPVTESYHEVTQECLDDHLLHIEGFGTQYPVIEGIDSIFLRVRLPDGLSCSHCVLQWRYHAGNSWGTDIYTGKSCLGCGHQEEFYNCADISIASNDNNFLLPLPMTTAAEEPLFVYPYIDPVVLPSGIEHFPIFAYPIPTAAESKRTSTITTTIKTKTTTPTTTITTTTTTEAMDSIYPLQSAEELLEQIHRNNNARRCYPTNEVLKPIIGIENWCLHLCAVHCPPTLCACVQL